MKIKQAGYSSSTLNRFDLLGNDEVGLSKAFAYLLSVEPSILFKFLREIGVSTKNTETNFKEIVIDIERKRDEGRTDIEIIHCDKFHVIVECKVRTNRITAQRTQYFESFNKTEKSILCFITQERDSTHQATDDVDVYYKGWLDVIDMLDQNDIDSSQIVREFVNYVTKGFKMKNQKEVLIQDLGNVKEINRFVDCHVYRRDATFGSPLYFAPYFTRASNRSEGEGISYLSKVLGVITAKAKDIQSFRDELLSYAEDENLVNTWLKGTKDVESEEPVTYYFLAKPVKFIKPLLKDGGNKPGRGKDWIAAMIPKNRCVTFEVFTKKIIDTQF